MNVYEVIDWKKVERSFAHLKKYLGYIHDHFAKNDTIVQNLLDGIWRSSFVIVRPDYRENNTGLNISDSIKRLGRGLMDLHEYMWKRYGDWAKIHRSKSKYLKKMALEFLEIASNLKKPHS